MAKVIGITGSIGSGKSTVGDILASCGVPVIDTDKIVHALLASDESLKTKLIAEFGPAVAGASGIDRSALGRLVFADPEKRKRLEEIVHPLVRAECRKQVEKNSQARVVAVLVPLLFEAGLENEYDQIWTVVANEDVLRERLRQRSGLSNKEIEQRLAAQTPQAEKARRSHHVIDNSASLEETRAAVNALLCSIK